MSIAPQPTATHPAGSASPDPPPQLAAHSGQPVADHREDTAVKKYGWKVRLAAWAGSAVVWLVLHLLFLTCKKRVFGREKFEEARRQYGGRALAGSWHRGLFYTVFHFRNDNAVIMSSRSKDGELVTAVLHRFGYAAPRGSSSNGGKEALAEFVDLVRSGRTGGLAVDAPRGPAYQVKFGLIAATARAQAVLFPFVWSASRQVRFKSWDRTVLPLPFSTITAVYDDNPITLPEDAPKPLLEATRASFETRLRGLTYQVDHWHELNEPNRDPRTIPVPDTFKLD